MRKRIKKPNIKNKINALKKTNYKKAEKILKKTYQEIIYLSNDYIVERKYDLAIKCLCIATELASQENKGSLYYRIGFIYSLVGRIKEEKKYYKTSIKYGNIKALGGLGTLYIQENNYKLAEDYLVKALEQGYNMAFNNLGSLYFKQGKYEIAEKYYKEFINLESEKFGEKFYKSESMCNLGYLYQKQNRNDLAEEYYKMAVDYNNHPRSMIYLGDLYKNNKNYSLAEKYYEMAVLEMEKIDIRNYLGVREKLKEIRKII